MPRVTNEPTTPLQKIDRCETLSHRPRLLLGKIGLDGHDRGVKLIGATAHYVTAELDAGPIISQDVLECSHRDGVSDLARKGRDVERNTLSRAVRWSIERRLMVQGDRVVVFG